MINKEMSQYLNKKKKKLQAQISHCDDIEQLDRLYEQVDIIDRLIGNPLCGILPEEDI